MKRDNSTLIYEAIGAAFTPEQVHLLASTVATPEQIAARAARITKTDAAGNPIDATPDAERLILADSLHTYNTWKAQGLQVRGGQKALLSCMLWRWTDKPSKARRDEAAAHGKDAGEDAHYYMKRCYLFASFQVGKPEPVHIKTPEEIAARNAELAAARKARKAAQQAAATTAPAAQAEFLNWDSAEVKAELDRRNAENGHAFVDQVMADVERITATTPSKPAAVVAVVEHHTLHDDTPAPEPVHLDFATLAAQVLA